MKSGASDCTLILFSRHRSQAPGVFFRSDLEIFGSEVGVCDIGIWRKPMDSSSSGVTRTTDWRSIIFSIDKLGVGCYLIRKRIWVTRTATEGRKGGGTGESLPVSA